MGDAGHGRTLGWQRVKAPSIEEIDAIAAAAFHGLPERFRQLCIDLIIRVEDFPPDEIVDEFGLDSEFDLMGLFQGIGMPFQSESAPVKIPNLIWLYRRPILDYWAEHDETLGAIVTHVLIHEIGHHFGLSDADIAAIEKGAG